MKIKKSAVKRKSEVGIVSEFKPGKLWVICGYYVSDTTSLATKILADAAVVGGKAAVYIPLRKPMVEDGVRLVEVYGRTRLADGKKTRLSLVQGGRVIKAVDDFSEAPLYIGDIVPSGFTQFFKAVRKFVIKYKPGLVVIDNGDLLRAYPAGKGGATICGELKKLAVETKSAVVLGISRYSPNTDGEGDCLIGLGR
ncbi:MAG: hypothetical protein A2117_01310 [Candidatus Wildermuthbacteria bacterium GWA2_46_15]|uniref:SF4 helicase domain-containing protein n=1 Tax=Candidatus Wildermuthbacteria bacterium GWA2_46_15 TaxID=1802443 RepID=A0A1G2QQ27_9BACT|nr:MAG: hypothetical protein A2117_01310 [Candidatus Wildermuthbacteria bacterium GWA2_46_15]